MGGACSAIERAAIERVSTANAAALEEQEILRRNELDAYNAHNTPLLDNHRRLLTEDIVNHDVNNAASTLSTDHPDKEKRASHHTPHHKHHNPHQKSETHMGKPDQRTDSLAAIVADEQLPEKCVICGGHREEVPGCIHMHPGKCTDKEGGHYIWTCCRKKENATGCKLAHAPLPYHPGVYRFGWDCCGYKDRGAVGCKNGAPHHHSKYYMLMQTQIAAHTSQQWACCHKKERFADGCHRGFHHAPFVSEES